jgi:DNA repair exonuclease SbcCD ATPase subunit
MNIQITRLKLIYFKGMTYTLDNLGDKTTIRGTNASGKTTLFDAFCWCLWGKDSKGNTDFAIKTIEFGKAIPQIDHTVSVTLRVDRDGAIEERTFTRTYREVWTKKRGSASAQLTGHETLYFVDGVPCKQIDYKVHIENIIDEETFKLLTSPAYFPALDWKKRREILIELVGGVSEKEIISSEFKELEKVLGNRTAEDHKKVISERKRNISKELEKIAERLDELKRTPPPKRELESIADEGNAVTQKIRELEAGLVPDERAAALTKKIRDYEREKEAEYTDAYRTYNTYLERMKELEHSIRSRKAESAKLSQKLAELKTEYDAVLNKPRETNGVCSFCGQPLPPLQIKAAEGKFKEWKINYLKDLNKLGKDTAEKLKSEQALTADAEQQLEKLKSKTAEKPTEWLKSNDDEYKAMLLELNNLPLVSEDKTEINRLKLQLDEITREYAAAELAEQRKQRIKELERELENLQAEYEEIEQILFEIERLTTRKVQMLDERLSKNFQNVRFKMFEKQMNGGMSECCQILVIGVPYGQGLNKAAEINVGLEIINVLSKHYGIRAPVWIDNAEAVVELYPLESQTIRLIVDEKAKSLIINKE